MDDKKHIPNWMKVVMGPFCLFTAILGVATVLCGVFAMFYQIDQPGGLSIPPPAWILVMCGASCACCIFIGIAVAYCEVRKYRLNHPRLENKPERFCELSRLAGGPPRHNPSEEPVMVREAPPDEEPFRLD